MKKAETITSIPEKAQKMHGLISQIKTSMARNIVFPVLIGGETHIHKGPHLSPTELATMLINEENQEYLKKDESLRRRIDTLMENPSAIIYGKTKQGRNQTDEAIGLLKRTYSLKTRGIKENFYNGSLGEDEFVQQITPIIGAQFCLGNVI